ncbi:hypothetical protein ABT314_36175, partial [Streptomyces spiralis]
VGLVNLDPFAVYAHVYVGVAEWFELIDVNDGLDIEALSLALWQRLGVEETKTYFNWTATEQDNTHFNPPGAIAVARLVAGELLRTRVLTPHDVVRLHDEIPPSWITWPEASSAPDA